MDEFLALYKKDFDTGGTRMETFLGMVFEQSDKSIKIHLDNYVKDVVAEYAEYAEYIKKALHSKKVPISPGVAFKAEDVPEIPDQSAYPEALSLVCSKASVCGNMDLVRHFVRGIAVGTVLLIGVYSSMGSAPPSEGFSV